MPSLRIAGQDVPLVGGESLRHVPGALENRLLAGWARSRAPHHFTFKLWELDPDLARLAVLSSVQRLICYRNHHLFEERFARLLERAAFSPVRAHLGLAEEKVARTAPLAPVSAPPAEPEVPGVPVSIIVPCFNEEAGLSYLANVFSALDAELGRRHRLSFVLVDDGSTDRTRQEMQRLFGHDGRYRIVRHEMNRGIAAAILTGIGAAKDDIVVTMDSDCSYDPARIEDMLALLAPDVALVTASPYHADAGVEGVPGWRIFVSRGASSLYRMVLRTQLATYTSCFRVYRKRALEGLILHHEGFIGVAEMLARLDMAGGRIAEYPVVLEARVLGRSKLRLFRTIVGHLRLLGAIFATRLRDRRRAGAIALTKEEG
ncbi:glycosyltransferase [Albidovulum aquaemixtae]|nr:glycosyltransferase [Defluviimonas aquaemixtae]